MSQWIDKMWKLVLITILGFVGSMIVGLIKYGINIFDPQTAGFAYFIMFGLSTSFIFAFYHVWGFSHTLVAALAVSTTFFIVIASLWMPIFSSAFWSFGVNLSVVVLAFLFERKFAYFKQWKFIIVGIIYGAVFVVLTLLVGIITKVTAMPPELFQNNYLDGMELGFGLGIGIEIAESIVHSIEQHKQAKHQTR